jgi:Protein of unknown function (DUF1761)
MLRMNHPAVLVAAVAAFILSSFYYRLFAQQIVDLHAASPQVAAAMMKPAPWKALAEVGRTIVVAYVLALLVARLGIRDAKDAAALAVLLWIGFSLVMWTGAIIWEGVPLKLAAIHTGDWLLKTLLITVILGMWRR